MIGDSSWHTSGLSDGGDQPSLADAAEAALWDHPRDWELDPWRDQAACRSSNAGMFLPIGRTGRAIAQIQAAKSVCQSCEVQETCLLFALDTNQDAGIWGGTTEDERRQLRGAWLSGRPHLRTVTE